MLVADGTRPETRETARELRARVESVQGVTPCVLLLNKRDLRDAWQLGAELLKNNRATLYQRMKACFPGSMPFD